MRGAAVEAVKERKRKLELKGEEEEGKKMKT